MSAGNDGQETFIFVQLHVLRDALCKRITAELIDNSVNHLNANDLVLADALHVFENLILLLFEKKDGSRLKPHILTSHVDRSRNTAEHHKQQHNPESLTDGMVRGAPIRTLRPIRAD